MIDDQYQTQMFFLNLQLSLMYIYSIIHFYRLIIRFIFLDNLIKLNQNFEELNFICSLKYLIILLFCYSYYLAVFLMILLYKTYMSLIKNFYLINIYI